jgi:hypothetical protein
VNARSALLPALLALCACGAEPPSQAAAVRAPATPPPAAVAAPATAAERFVLPGDFAPDVRVEQLQRRYGRDNVRIGEVPGAEGETAHGVVLFPDDPTRRAYLYFEDAAALRGLQLVRVLDPGSRWHFADGIGIGTPLSELVALNRKPLRFLGFDWDYGGAVTDWNGGALAPATDKAIVRQVRLDHLDAAANAYPLGVGDYSSDDPRWPQLGRIAVVGAIAVSFPGEDDL